MLSNSIIYFALVLIETLFQLLLLIYNLVTGLFKAPLEITQHGSVKF